MPAKVIPVGTPVNDSERKAIADLRDRLPETYVLLHNFELRKEGESFEIDLAVLAPHSVVLADVKGTRGEIHVWGGKWYPEGRTPFPSPLMKLRSHARALKGMILETGGDRRALEGVYVDAAVVLTAPDAALDDPDGRERGAVTSLEKGPAFFQDRSRKPSHFSDGILALHARILSTIQGRGKPKTGPLRFGHWTVVERLGATSFCAEYRAVNSALGEEGGTVLLRVYRADPYLPEDRRRMQMARITNAYKALARVPCHPGIVDERDFFPTESEDQFVLVTEDPKGQALRTHIRKESMALPLERKWKVARDLLDALAHAHAHGVVHRNLNPGAVMIAEGDRTLITQFEYARAGHDRALTIAREIVDDLEKNYQAPECFGDPSAASPASDVFSLGVLLYELLAGRRPFAEPSEVFDRSAAFPEKPSKVEPRVPRGFDEWLQSLCAFEAESRPSAKDALRRLDAILAAKKP
ncbi:MAG: NERD domain-containing serine/threonine-protein kinase [Planctomycetes bacterium]|jgi:hypothetical protein|nr:NERD domain-containing serine/threonine-protein kinase [Planctomycetota bacterium]